MFCNNFLVHIIYILTDSDDCLNDWWPCIDTGKCDQLTWEPASLVVCEISESVHLLVEQMWGLDRAGSRRWRRTICLVVASPARLLNPSLPCWSLTAPAPPFLPPCPCPLYRRLDLSRQCRKWWEAFVVSNTEINYHMKGDGRSLWTLAVLCEMNGTCAATKSWQPDWQPGPTNLHTQKGPPPTPSLSNNRRQPISAPCSLQDWMQTMEFTGLGF